MVSEPLSFRLLSEREGNWYCVVRSVAPSLRRVPVRMVKVAQLEPGECGGDGTNCFARSRWRQVACSTWKTWVQPGTIYACAVTADEKEGPHAYFCADCFETSRPKSWWCDCKENAKWRDDHRKLKGLPPVSTPPGPPLEAPPTTPQPLPPGPPPSIALPTSPWSTSPSTATSSAPSPSAGIADYQNLVSVVERLQREMTEMRQMIAQLQNTVQALQTVPEQM